MTRLVEVAERPTQTISSDRFHQSPPINAILRGTVVVLGLGALVLSLWAYLVPVSGGIVAAGSLAVELSRRSVQSQDGGIIERLLVKEGSTVERGDVVVVFDRVQAQSNYDVADARYLRALATHSRLRAELAGSPEISWPPEIRTRADEPLVRTLQAVETDLRTARLQFVDGRRDVLTSRVDELQQRKQATRHEIESFEEQLVLIHAEETDVSALYDRGFETRPRLLGLQRQAADVQGEIGALQSTLSSIRESENGTKLELANISYERTMSIVGELTEVEGVLSDATERRLSAAATLQQSEVRAPESGTVVDLRFFGPGGVVRPGEPIFDLVPTPDALIIRARVRPVDIDSVYVNQSALVRLNASRSLFDNPVSGVVRHISADSLLEEDRRTSYFEVLVELDREDAKRKLSADLQPGMVVDVVLATEERTFVQYLLSPISRALFLGFREY